MPTVSDSSGLASHEQQAHPNGTSPKPNAAANHFGTTASSAPARPPPSVPRTPHASVAAHARRHLLPDPPPPDSREPDPPRKHRDPPTAGLGRKMGRRGEPYYVEAAPPVDVNKNTEWFMYPGVWTTYILLLFFAWLLVLSVSGCSPGAAWTVVNLAHFAVSL